MTLWQKIWDTLEQDFSATAVLAFGSGLFLVVRGYPVHCRMFSRIPELYWQYASNLPPPATHTHMHTHTTHTLLSSDNWNYFKILPNALCWEWERQNCCSKLLRTTALKQQRALEDRFGHCVHISPKCLLKIKKKKERKGDKKEERKEDER